MENENYNDDSFKNDVASDIVKENSEDNKNDKSKEEVVNNKLDELKKSINTLKGKITTLESKKKDLEKEANDLIASTIYQKKRDLERSYDEILKEAEQRLKVVERQKIEERKKNLNIAIDHNTRSIKENNVYLGNEIKRILKENKLPGFINSYFYFSLWNPTTMNEMIGSVVGILVMLSIPTIISFVSLKDVLLKAFPNNILRWIMIILIYLAAIFVFGIIWLLIDKLTKKNSEIIKEIKEIRKNIFDNKKEIDKVIKSTSEEMTDDKFDYTKLDREIEAGKIEVENYRNKKKEALEHFVNVTQDEIERKIGSEAKKGMDAIDRELENVKEELLKIQREHDELKISMVLE